MRSEYWEQQVLRVFTCSCHQRKLRQPLLGVTNEDTHIDHLVQWKENSKSCDLISIDQLEASAYRISCALREHLTGCLLGHRSKIRKSKFFNLVSISRDLFQFLLIEGVFGLFIHCSPWLDLGNLRKQLSMYGGRMLGSLMMLPLGVQ